MGRAYSRPMKRRPAFARGSTQFVGVTKGSRARMSRSARAREARFASANCRLATNRAIGERWKNVNDAVHRAPDSPAMPREPE
ncbi:hypothetical protein A8H35_06515 [Burkholderia thailandensis]|uniref:Uncharacterized protein n=1 Tax=Burkholderia thailandensis (strain ATCC 700388 / DSM 13276 / CCUG 48851 / CIP 106301 / E264) TaxID=271848 RepID=Q2STH0_BURTA|nr:hypothetical protein BTH_I3287 [Burkholderia thailandensis E264]AOJ43768.1 hypothetical protein WJ27_00810 [Burkholderia thailandensis]AVR09120.1 hypothetical protein A8H31_16755 [Burkholderia thailandensis]AWY58146.1 hypothetical protein A8H35_06515 [Burkholderia thailandensis]AWY67678.1 hypothetical protein A8H36_21815 [Burkholderia thailandensis]